MFNTKWIKKWFCRYQGDKIKDGRHDPNIFPNFLKNWYSLGINTCIQYVEHQMNWKNGFVDTRVAGYGWEEAPMRGAAATGGQKRTKTKSLPLVGGALIKSMICMRVPIIEI